MKTKLLKKLRKRAYKEIGMKSYLVSNNKLHYKIILRENGAMIDNFSDYNNAVKALKEYRREMILKWAKEILNEKINIDVEKL